MASKLSSLTMFILCLISQKVIFQLHDESNRTVIDLIPEYQHLNIFPVGRLDKDTEGLLLITNDGQFSHDLMSPLNMFLRHMK